MLCGKWLCDEKATQKYRVYQSKHWITNEFWGGYVRHNIINREVYDNKDKLVNDEFLVENHAIMMYQPYLEESI